MDEIGAVLGEQHALGDLAHLVAGATDALQTTGHRRRRLDLDHQIDCAHVDSELQTAGGHNAAQTTGLQIVFDQRALILADTAVVGPCQQRIGTVVDVGCGAHLRWWFVLGIDSAADTFGVHLVEPRGESFREPARVGEDDARFVLEDEIDHLLLDVRPDRSLSRGSGGGVRIRVGDAEFGHVLHGHLNRQVESLRCGWGDDLDGGGTGEESAHFLVGAHRRGQADALRGLVQHRVEALEGHREVRATLRACHGVHLVDDHRIDLGQDVPRRRGEHEEQRLGSGDQNVRRSLDHGPAIGSAGVARADSDGNLRRVQTETLGCLGDADQRSSQVALDVHCQSLERRYVEHLGLAGAVRTQLGQLVEGPQERRQRFARAGRRDHQGVRSAGNGRPRTELRRRGSRKCAVEPLASRPRQLLHDVGADTVRGHPTIMPRGTDR
ncbi:unannotated protein [freshwater metagenome]|uniref:Unannotated protein n=1 Tax=freshwater metagenome TaxID=449393 RepID=A0A6J7G5P3_9ZZZZ